MRLEPPRPSRRHPLTSNQRAVMRRLAEGGYIVDDTELTLEPIGLIVARVTLRALVRAGLVNDAVPLFDEQAGRPTKHGWDWIRREFGSCDQ